MNADMEVELQQIERILTEIIGRPSRWSGHVELTADPEVRGMKPFRCDIIINENLMGQDARWRTLIHELLHSYSVGYNSSDYEASRGWEEGVVEQLQRLLRQTVLSRLGVVIDKAVFDEDDQSHRYNPYIAALEALRLAFCSPAEAFYLDLLAVPIKDRPGFLLGPGLALSQPQRKLYIKTFSNSDAALKIRRP